MPILDCRSMRIDLRNQRGAINASVLEQVRSLLLATTAFNHLALSENELTEDEVATLSVILKDRSALRTLELQNCGLNDVLVCLYIVPAMLEHKTLRALNLAHNPQITDRSAEALAQFMVQGDVLALNLVGTGVGKQGGAALAEALEVSVATEVLALPFTVRFRVLHRVAMLLERNVRHKALLGSNCPHDRPSRALTSVSNGASVRSAAAQRLDTHAHSTTGHISAHPKSPKPACTCISSFKRHALPELAQSAPQQRNDNTQVNPYRTGGHAGKFFLKSLKYCSGPYSEPQVFVSAIAASSPGKECEEVVPRNVEAGADGAIAACLSANIKKLEQMALARYERTQQPKRRCALVPLMRSSATVPVCDEHETMRSTQCGVQTRNNLGRLDHAVDLARDGSASHTGSSDKKDDTLLCTYHVDHVSKKMVCNCVAGSSSNDNTLPFKMLIDPALRLPLRCLSMLHNTVLQKSELRQRSARWYAAV